MISVYVIGVCLAATMFLLPRAADAGDKASVVLAIGKMVGEELTGKLRPRNEQCLAKDGICVDCEGGVAVSFFTFCSLEKGQTCKLSDIQIFKTQKIMKVDSLKSIGCGRFGNEAAVKACKNQIDAISTAEALCRDFKTVSKDFSEVVAMFATLPERPFKRSDAFRDRVKSLIEQFVRPMLHLTADGKCPKDPTTICPLCNVDGDTTGFYCINSPLQGCRKHATLTGIGITEDDTMKRIRNEGCKKAFGDNAYATQACMEYINSSLGPDACVPDTYADVSQILALFK